MGDGNWVSPASDFSSPSPRAAYEVEDEDMIDDVDACAPCARRGLSERGASKPKRAARTCHEPAKGRRGSIHTTLTRHAWHINLPN